MVGVVLNRRRSWSEPWPFKEMVVDGLVATLLTLGGLTLLHFLPGPIALSDPDLFEQFARPIAWVMPGATVVWWLIDWVRLRIRNRPG